MGIENEEKNESEERVRLMLDSSPLCCHLWDENLKIFDCNKASIELYGFKSKQECLDNFSKLHPEYQPDGMSSIEKMSVCVAKAFKEGSHSFEWVHKMLDGTLITTEKILKRVKYGDRYIVASYTQDMRVQKKMIEDIEKRDTLLQAVNQVATSLLNTNNQSFEDTLHYTMEMLAHAIEVDRMYIWKNHTIDGNLYCTQIYEWSEDVESQQGNEYTVNLAYSDAMPEMLEFAKGNSLNGPITNMVEASYQYLSAQGIKSILMVPIFLEDQFWGFMGFDDCHNERTFTESEESILRSASLLFANALLRNEMIKNLQETSIQLNERLQQQQLMSNISKSFISSKGSLDHSIQDALAQMASFMSADRALIAVFEKNSEISHPAYFWFANSKYAPSSSQKGFSSIIRELFPQYRDDNEDNLSIYCSNTLMDPNEKFKIFYEKGGLKSFVAVPIYIESELWGVMSIENHENFRQWSDNDATLISTVSSAISNAVIRDVMEQERANALKQAVQASKSKSDFLSHMSHEIRTPMNAIIGMTTIGKKAKTIEDTKQALNKIGDASTHLLNVINDILDMSKIEANKLELSPIDFDFRRTLENTINIIEIRANEHNQQIHINLDENIPTSLFGDEHRLTQVITNLLSNAVKFTPDGGTISIDTKFLSQINDNSCRMQISVSDTGIGLTENQIEKLFEPFVQASSGTSRMYGGTGLGLPICKKNH